MRSWVYFLVPFLFQCAYAENPQKIGRASFCCIYQHYVKTKNLADSTVVDSTLAILEVGDIQSKFGNYSSYEGYKPEAILCYDSNGNPRFDDCYTVYQNFPENGFLTIREGLLPNFYTYMEKMSLDWSFSNDEDEVLGYRCKKAQVDYGGRTWIVSFAEEIPSASGPWKLCGLPGLILEARTVDGVHCFVAKALFNVPSQDILLDKHPKDIKIKRDNFITLRNKLKTDDKWAKNAGYYLTNKDIRSFTSIAKNNKYGLEPSIKVNGLSFPPTGGFERLFQPLELK